jgi:endoglucanase
MTPQRNWTTPFALSIGLGTLVAATGCIAPQPSAPGAAPGSPASIGGASSFKDCGPEGLVDDGEDGNNQNLPVGNRGGYWYTFMDKTGTTTVTPMAGDQGGTFAMSEGGANGTKFAANFKGKVGTGGSVVFSGMGVNFVDPKDKYDASKYAGIAFFAKRGESSTGKLRLKVPDTNTDPDGGVCSECFNDFGADIVLSTDWKKYIFPFKKMTQEVGWGAPRKPHINPAGIYGVQFQVKVPGASYDISIDDVQFLCQ